MMNINDINETRNLAIEFHGLHAANRAYAMYYDETYNIRRLHVCSNGLNVSNPQCFVIGGIAHTAPIRTLELNELRATLRIQKTATEIKLKHVAKGEFLDLLQNSRLEIFLKWIKDQGLFIHYFAVDPLYWSIVDVIDSILVGYGETVLMQCHMLLKDDLYTILRYDYDKMINIFQRYSYPNVGHNNRGTFIEELLNLLEAQQALLEHFNFMMLKGILQIAESLDALPFLENEPPNVLIDSFKQFYIERVCLFKNASHILDEEAVIQQYFAETELYDGDKKIDNFRFAVSHNEAGIQLSDIIVGLLGKMFSFICTSDTAKIISTKHSLTAQQQRNLSLLCDLIDRSDDENKAFFQFVLSITDQKKAIMLLQ